MRADRRQFNGIEIAFVSVAVVSFVILIAAVAWLIHE